MTASHRDVDQLKSEMLACCTNAIANAKTNRLKMTKVIFQPGEIEYLPLVFESLENMGHAFFVREQTLEIWNLYPWILPDKTPSRKKHLTTAERLDIISRYKNGESMITLAKEYGRSREAIRKVIKSANFCKE